MNCERDILVRGGKSVIRNGLRIAQMLALCTLLLTALGAERGIAASNPPQPAAQLFVLQARLKLIVTMSADAAKNFLATANLPSDVAQSLAPTLPQTACDLPEQVASQLFEISAGDNNLTAEKVSISTDDTNVLFTVIYPRPENGILSAKAIYPAASFVARDENQELLNAALLGRESSAVHIQLPAIESATTKWKLPEEPTDEVSDDDMEMPAVAAPAAPMATPAPAPSFGQLVGLGLANLLTGLEHVLFLGLLLIAARRILPMLGVIACFTAAQSVTLALALSGVWTMPPAWIEPLIIVSIIAAAADNLLRREAIADRYWLAGIFGLVHGFDFARVLHEKTSDLALPMSMVSFNIGLTLGQVAVAAVAVPIFLMLRRVPALSRIRSQQ